jgi:hypothetical protein
MPLWYPVIQLPIKTLDAKQWPNNKTNVHTPATIYTYTKMMHAHTHTHTHINNNGTFPHASIGIHISKTRYA